MMVLRRVWVGFLVKEIAQYWHVSRLSCCTGNSPQLDKLITSFKRRDRSYGLRAEGFRCFRSQMLLASLDAEQAFCLDRL